MLELTIPGVGKYNLKHFVFDVNGTLATDGIISDSVIQKIQQLRTRVDIHLITADTHGKQHEIDRMLGLEAIRIQPGNEAKQKAKIIKKLGPAFIAAFGNGANDLELLKTARLSILILGAEGADARLFKYADIVTRSIDDALDLFLNSKRLIATLRR